MPLSAHVSGDPDGGWITEIHDGDQQTTHMPDSSEHPSMLAAMIASLRERFGEEWDALVHPKSEIEKDANTSTGEPATTVTDNGGGAESATGLPSNGGDPVEMPDPNLPTAA